MFLEFFYALREGGVPVAIQEWMMLMKALAMGQHSEEDEAPLLGLNKQLLRLLRKGERVISTLLNEGPEPGGCDSGYSREQFSKRRGKGPGKESVGDQA